LRPDTLNLAIEKGSQKQKQKQKPEWKPAHISRRDLHPSIFPPFSPNEKDNTKRRGEETRQERGERERERERERPISISISFFFSE
jgi:hypothetical protein